MLISVIIPVYNVEKYLRRCVESVMLQTYKDIEILLIDDGSTDRSGRICDELAHKDIRIHAFHKENGGVSSARNLGIERACGEYICFKDRAHLYCGRTSSYAHEPASWRFFA